MINVNTAIAESEKKFLQVIGEFLYLLRNARSNQRVPPLDYDNLLRGVLASSEKLKRSSLDIAILLKRPKANINDTKMGTLHDFLMELNDLNKLLQKLKFYNEFMKEYESDKTITMNDFFERYSSRKENEWNFEDDFQKVFLSVPANKIEGLFSPANKTTEQLIEFSKVLEKYKSGIVEALRVRTA